MLLWVLALWSTPTRLENLTPRLYKNLFISLSPCRSFLHRLHLIMNQTWEPVGTGPGLLLQDRTVPSPVRTCGCHTRHRSPC